MTNRIKKAMAPLGMNFSSLGDSIFVVLTFR